MTTLPDNQDISLTDPNVTFDQYSPFFQPTSTTVEEPPPVDPPADEPQPDEQPDETQPEEVTLPDGRSIPLDRFNTVYEFDQFIQSNPTAWQRIQSILQAPPVLGPQPTPAASPPDLRVQATPPPPLDEYADPATKALYDRLSALETRLVDQATYAEQERQRNAQAALSTASSRFQARMTLSDDQMQRLQWKLADTGIAQAQLQTTPMDPVGAIERAFEYAFYTTPELRDPFLAKQSSTKSNQTKKDTARKNKLSAVSGAGGSTQPEPPAKPRTRQEKIELIANEVARSRAGM